MVLTIEFFCFEVLCFMLVLSSVTSILISDRVCGLDRVIVWSFYVVDGEVFHKSFGKCWFMIPAMCGFTSNY